MGSPGVLGDTEFKGETTMAAFLAAVNTSCTFADLEKQVRNKVNEIAQDGAESVRNSHGKVELSDGTTCDHWRAGDYRIFGSWNAGQGQFDFIGWGMHTGRGNDKYKVFLCSGKTTKAETT
jgi:hypothetical protein